jgi:hypothetical protein
LQADSKFDMQKLKTEPKELIASKGKEMVKLDSEGNISVGNEKIHYKWYRSGRFNSLTGCYHYCIETTYNRELISIDDYGNGLEYAKRLLKDAILKRQKV